MATSGSSDFSLTARQLGQAALEELGVIALGDDPPAEYMDKAQQALNLMLKTWGASPDPKLWLLTETSVTLVASTASYNLITTPGARKVIEVRLRKTSSGIDTPLQILSRQEYYDLPDKAGTGTPTCWWFDAQRATRPLYVWKVPTATIATDYTLRISYLRVIEDIDALDNDFDVPQEWFETIKFGLAARLINPFKVHIADPQLAADVRQRAAELHAQLASYDEEAASVFIQPA